MAASKEQIIKRNTQIMKVLDLNEDGFLSIEDYKIAADKYANLNPGVKQKKIQVYLEALKKQFEFLGLGQGEKITINQAAELAAKNAHNSEFISLTKAQFSAGFDILDVNNNGYLSHTEWRALMEAMKFSNSFKAKEIFEALDLNQDGRLSREEYVEMSFEYWHTGENKYGGNFMFGNE